MSDKSKIYEITEPNEEFPTVICCGKIRKSRYCPDCGHSLFVSVNLRQLRDLCVMKYDRTRKKLLRCNEKYLDESNPKIRRWYYGRIEKLSANLHRWQNWTDQLNLILCYRPSKSRVLPNPRDLEDWLSKC